MIRVTRLYRVLYAVLIATSVLGLSLNPSPTYGQNWLSERITPHGYVKFMQTNVIQNSDSILTDNLLHNRLNFRLQFTDRLRGGIEARNRIFYGEVVKSIPGYGDIVTDYDGVLNLEKAWINTDNLVVNTVIDRLWLDYGGDRFEARIGRQRLNWGYNPVWNPNDLFNAFDYLDFDYEERPGSDAVHAEYYLGPMSSIDAAYKWAKDSDNNVGAIRVQTNKWSYDIQFLAGRYQQDWAAGLGWAGNIGTAGFKGEATLFIPSKDDPADQNSSGTTVRTATDNETTLSYTSTVEYGFQNGWSVLGSYLLNSSGTGNSGSLGRFLIFTPSAKNLMPNKHTVLFGTYRQFSPVFMLNLSAMYAFEVNWIIFLPTVSYSVRENWDIDLVGQLFWGENNTGALENQGNGVYFRLRWSF